MLKSNQGAMAILMFAILLLGGMKAAAPQRMPAAVVAPPLAPGTWINGTPTPLTAYKGKVVVLAFWTFECINCKRTLPFWNRWATQYGKGGKSDVAVVSVHTPEMQPERDLGNVRDAVRHEGIRFPVVTDNDFTTWNRFKVEVWPTTILLDKQGREVARWQGELDYNGAGTYRQVEAMIERLRKEK